jgi:membrane fusion protein, multidrug efflux system
VFANFKAFVVGLYERFMPGFWLRMDPKYQWAFGIAAFVVLYLMTGLLRFGAGDAAKTETKTAEMSSVRVAMLDASLRDATLTVRGHTQALHQVEVRAEVDGVVEALRFERGDRVKKGAVLCAIKLNDRGAHATQARAQMDQAAKELQVAKELYKEGFRSKTQMAQATSAYEAAKAGAATMDIQLANTKVRAPFDGMVDERYVDVGDYMRSGDKCAMIMAPEPFLAVGTVSEEEVGQIIAGQPATATLVTGETVQGKVRFVAGHADPVTRTFRVEVELPNREAKLRDGVSVDVHIPVKKIYAHFLSSGVLVLDDTGRLGVRTVANGRVKFMPVQIVSDGAGGTWVSGLPQRVGVIVVGQQFVIDGQRVKAVFEKARS